MFENSYTQEVIAKIEQSQGATLPLIIKDLIKANGKDSNHMKVLWDEYKGVVPIKSDPRVDNPTIPDDRIANDFRGLLIDQAVGYIFGRPIKYIIDDETPDFEKAKDTVDTFLKRTNYEALDAETETFTAACGKSFRILYFTDWTDAFGNESVQVIQKNIKPWEGIVISDSTTGEPVFGLIYYQVELPDVAIKKFRNRVEFYDDTTVYYFLEDASGNYLPDDLHGDVSAPHGFKFMPLIKFANNTLEFSDFEKIRTNIDGYDRAISYSVQDMRSFAQAYLLFYGIEPTQEVLDAARKTGAFYVPTDNDADSNNKVEFLTKDIKIENVTEITKILAADIYAFGAGINMNDETFSGASQTGESRKWKLLPLEMKAKVKERLYVDALQRLFRVAGTFWNMTLGLKINYEDMRFIFSRTLPVDINVEETVSLHKEGLITTETALENLKFVDNPSKEALKVIEETANNDTGSV